MGKRACVVYSDEDGISLVLSALKDASGTTLSCNDADKALLGNAGMELLSGLLGYGGGKRSDMAWKFVRSKGVEALYAFVGSGDRGTEARLTAAYKNVCDALGGEEDQEEFVNDRLLPPTKALLLQAEGEAAKLKALSSISLLAQVRAHVRHRASGLILCEAP